MKSRAVVESSPHDESRANWGVASHPSRIGEISVSARNPPLRRRYLPPVPLARSPLRALPYLLSLLRKPRRACHARCIVVLSTAISLSVSRRHRNPSRAHVLTSPPTSRTRTCSASHALKNAFPSVSIPRENPLCRTQHAPARRRRRCASRCTYTCLYFLPRASTIVARFHAITQATRVFARVFPLGL